MTASQLDLFPRAMREPNHPVRALNEEEQKEEEEFVASIRAELQATLLRVTNATALPWRDLTRATLAELRFQSMAGWLPEAEASQLRSAFVVEMRRIYVLIGEA